MLASYILAVVYAGATYCTYGARRDVADQVALSKSSSAKGSDGSNNREAHLDITVRKLQCKIEGRLKGALGGNSG